MIQKPCIIVLEYSFEYNDTYEYEVDIVDAVCFLVESAYLGRDVFDKEEYPSLTEFEEVLTEHYKSFAREEYEDYKAYNVENIFIRRKLK